MRLIWHPLCHIISRSSRHRFCEQNTVHSTVQHRYRFTDPSESKHNTTNLNKKCRNMNIQFKASCFDLFRFLTVTPGSSNSHFLQKKFIFIVLHPSWVFILKKFYSPIHRFFSVGKKKF